MSKPKYRPEADGAVFDRRPTTPPTAAELQALLAVDPLRDRVAECQALALSVLTNHYGRAVELIKNDPHTGSEPLQWPIAGSVPEIIVDAFEILDLSRSVRTLERCASDEAFASNRQAIVRNLANCMMALGSMFVVVGLRLEGVESDVLGRVSQKQNLQPRAKVDIDEATLRKQWERAKRLKPHATKQVWRESVASAVGASESTIKRRLREFKIV